MATLLEDGETTKFVFTGNPEVNKGLHLLEDEIRGPTGTNEIVVIESSTFTVDDPEFRQVVESLTADLAGLGPDIIRLETAEYHGAGCCCPGVGDGVDLLQPTAPLFTVAGQHKQRIIDAHGQSNHGDDVFHEEGQLENLANQRRGSQGDHDGHDGHYQRHPGRREGSQHHDQDYQGDGGAEQLTL